MVWDYLSVQQQGVNQAVMSPKDANLTLVWACQCVCIVSALCWVTQTCALSGVGTVSQHKIIYRLMWGLFFSLLDKSSALINIQNCEAVSPTKVRLESGCNGHRLGLLVILRKCFPGYISGYLIWKAYLNSQGRGKRLWSRGKKERLPFISWARGQ